MRIFLFFLISFILSCNLQKRIPGVYTIEQNSIENIQLRLKEDLSFIQYVRVFGCEPKWYFGFYSTKGKQIFLNQVSGDLGYLRKRDTIIYNNTSLVNERRIYVILNEQGPHCDADIYLQGGKHLGKVNSQGSLDVPSHVLLDSLIVKAPLRKPVQFKLSQDSYNQIFLVIYDYTFEDCSNFGFVRNLSRSKKGLKFLRNWETSKGDAPAYIFLFRDSVVKNRKTMGL